jgi:hypothetical protein
MDADGGWLRILRGERGVDSRWEAEGARRGGAGSLRRAQGQPPTDKYMLARRARAPAGGTKVNLNYREEREPPQVSG